MVNQVFTAWKLPHALALLLTEYYHLCMVWHHMVLYGMVCLVNIPHLVPQFLVFQIQVQLSMLIRDQQIISKITTAILAIPYRTIPYNTIQQYFIKQHLTVDPSVVAGPIPRHVIDGVL